MSNTTFKWGGDGPDVPTGKATYCLMAGDLEVPMPDFRTAFDFQRALDLEREHVAGEAREKIAKEIRAFLLRATRR